MSKLKIRTIVGSIVSFLILFTGLAMGFSIKPVSIIAAVIFIAICLLGTDILLFIDYVLTFEVKDDIIHLRIKDIKLITHNKIVDPSIRKELKRYGSIVKSGIKKRKSVD